MTSSTKPEVHNATRQRVIDPPLPSNMHRSLTKLGREVSEICDRTDIHYRTLQFARIQGAQYVVKLPISKLLYYIPPQRFAPYRGGI